MVNIRGYIFLAAAFFLAGSSVVAARFVSGKLGIFTIAAVSLFLALMGLLPVCWRGLGQTVRRVGIRDGINIVLQAIFGMFLFRMFLLVGLRHTSAAEAGILTGATPALTALLAWLMLRESLYTARVLGIIFTVAGVLLIQGLLSASTHLSPEHVLGNLLVLAAALCEALFNVLSRRDSIKRPDQFEMDPLVQTTLVTAIAFLLCLVPGVMERPFIALTSLGLTGWLALLWYGLFVTALGYICWYAGIKYCEAAAAAAFSGLMPLTAMALSAILLGEHTTTRQYLGGVLVVLGMLAAGCSSPVIPRNSIKAHFIKPT